MCAYWSLVRLSVSCTDTSNVISPSNLVNVPSNACPIFRVGLISFRCCGAKRAFLNPHIFAPESTWPSFGLCAASPRRSASMNSEDARAVASISIASPAYLIAIGSVGKLGRLTAFVLALVPSLTSVLKAWTPSL